MAYFGLTADYVCIAQKVCIIVWKNNVANMQWKNMTKMIGRKCDRIAAIERYMFGCRIFFFIFCLFCFAMLLHASVNGTLSVDVIHIPYGNGVVIEELYMHTAC